MLIPRSRCSSNDRCENCPINMVEDPNDITWSGAIVSASRRSLNNDITLLTSQLTVSTLVRTVERFADDFGKPELAGIAAGALAISIIDKCE